MDDFCERKSVMPQHLHVFRSSPVDCWYDEIHKLSLNNCRNELDVVHPEIKGQRKKYLMPSFNSTYQGIYAIEVIDI